MFGIIGRDKHNILVVVKFCNVKNDKTSVKVHDTAFAWVDFSGYTHSQGYQS